MMLRNTCSTQSSIARADQKRRCAGGGRPAYRHSTAMNEMHHTRPTAASMLADHFTMIALHALRRVFQI